jgi:hypothetical protein
VLHEAFLSGWADSIGKLGNVRTIVYEPNDDEAFMKKYTATEVPKTTPGRAVLVGLIERNLAGLMDPTVSLLEVHKLIAPGGAKESDAA